MLEDHDVTKERVQIMQLLRERMAKVRGVTVEELDAVLAQEDDDGER